MHRGGARLLVYASTETHTWIQKAADLFGHGTDSLRWIPVRDDLTIDVEALERRIEEDRREGHQPFLLVGNAGTVSTGRRRPARPGWPRSRGSTACGSTPTGPTAPPRW